MSRFVELRAPCLARDVAISTLVAISTAVVRASASSNRFADYRQFRRAAPAVFARILLHDHACTSLLFALRPLVRLVGRFNSGACAQMRLQHGLAHAYAHTSAQLSREHLQRWVAVPWCQSDSRAATSGASKLEVETYQLEIWHPHAPSGS